MLAFAQRSVRAACLLAVELVAAAAASAQGVYLPPAPTGSGGEDTIETSSGARCRQSINSNGAYLDLGVTGRASSGGAALPSPFSSSRGSGQDATGYARITMPLGPRPKRIDCSRLYEMEISRMKREIELLQMAAE